MKNITSQPSLVKQALSDLGLTPAASTTSIKHAYKRLAQRYHPDKGGTSSDFSRITNAYNYLVEHFNETTLPQIITISLTFSQQVNGAEGLTVECGGELIEFDLPPGLMPNDVLYIDTGTGNRVVLINDIDLAGYTMNNTDVCNTLNIDITTALRGGKVDVKYPDGTIKALDIQPGVQYNSLIHIKSNGLYNKTTNTRGDIVLCTKFTVPAITKETMPSFIQGLTNNE